ncbi:MAG: septum site-determining protein MinC [Gammaproteobacteria bacterium]|nr:MAG: septum site-determining protein MinC [Gammaproteobacteria bacterium]
MTPAYVTLKNNLPTVTLLQLQTQDIGLIKTALNKKFRQAPMMFIGMQLIVDVSYFDKDTSPFALDLKHLCDYLAGEGLQMLAVMSNRQSIRKNAVDLGLGALPLIEPGVKRKPQATGTSKPAKNVVSSSERMLPDKSTPETNADITPAKKKRPADQQNSNHSQTPVNEEPRKTFADSQQTYTTADANQTITHPIRSGQRIYTHGDLTVIGSVSAGAEVIADGNIHIYGTLRGRAIAGAKGNKSARIFCQALDAELVSIAGNYKPNEDIDDKYRGQRIQISLADEKICFLRL